MKCVTTRFCGSDPLMVSFPRRAASVLAGSALAFSLVSVPSAMVATAVAAGAECGTQASRDLNDAGTLWTTYTVQNEVRGDGTAAPGGELTYRVTVTGAGALINQISHYHDPALTPVSARVSSWKLIGGSPTWTDATANMVKDAGVVRVNSAGWTTAGGQAAVLEVTYKVPDDAEVGTAYDSGAGYNPVLATDADYESMGVCGTVRAPNPVESVQGSLEGLGAGALVEGSVSSSNISSDPSGFVGEAIGGILGNVIGGVVDS